MSSEAESPEDKVEREIKTTATNRKIRVLLTALKAEVLEPRPEFQRRLVWNNQHKLAFLDTVLNGYPFPEIYIAAGAIDPDTGEGKEMLVDGQQRITTLNQYFTGSSDIALTRDMVPYARLSVDAKKRFLEYEVVVRDLGAVSIDTIKIVFQKINSTRYSLNAMEVHNSRFDGEMKLFAESISSNEFFENRRVFSPNDVRRMNDTRFALTLIVTVMSTYFHRDDALEEYLTTYNDELEIKDELGREIGAVLAFVDSCGFGEKSRVWKKADLFTLIVELHRAIFKQKIALDPGEVGKEMSLFYHEVDNFDAESSGNISVAEYYKYSVQGTNDRTSRIVRGAIVRKLLNYDTEEE
jgi:Protein of unknown function DUF262